MVSTSKPGPGKLRLDKLLVERGLCESRTRAQALILAGEVVVGDHAVDKPGTLVDADANLRIKGPSNPYVSRGGLKLQAALDGFRPRVTNTVCMVGGGSRGGFPACLVQRGAARVYAIDVGYGQLAWKLASDARVVVLDRQNIRELEPAKIPERIDLAVADCSFISLTKVLPHLPAFLRERADVIALVKPQFEVGRGLVGKHGIVRDDALREAARTDVEDHARSLGFEVRGHLASPIAGRDGNREWLSWLTWAGS